AAHRAPHSVPTRRSSDLASTVSACCTGPPAYDVEPRSWVSPADTEDSSNGAPDRLIDKTAHPTAHAARRLVTVPAWSTLRCATRSEEHTSELQSLRHLVC